MSGHDRQSAEPGNEMVEMIDEAAAISSGSPGHDFIAKQMLAVAAASTGSRRYVLELGDSLAQVAAWTFEFTGRPIGLGAVWLRLIDPKRGTGLLVVAHSSLPLKGGGGEADLVVVGHAGMLSRGLIRDVCRWLFLAVGFRRIMARIPSNDAVVADYARRVGFTWEGRAADFYGSGQDATVWAMTADRCRWLPQASSPADDIPLPASFKVQ